MFGNFYCCILSIFLGLLSNLVLFLVTVVTGVDGVTGLDSDKTHQEKKKLQKKSGSRDLQSLLYDTKLQPNAQKIAKKANLAK